MGYLNNSVVTVDAVLTKKGRELLARGDGSFKITQFALSDDEVDYTLYNPEHPDGSAFYGQAIENMPVLEAFPDETQIMKYKLITLPRGTGVLPTVSIGSESVVLKQGEVQTISPQTFHYLGAQSVRETLGYHATIGDSRLVSTFNGIGISTPQVESSNDFISLGTNLSKSVVGTSFEIRGSTVNTLFPNGSTELTTSIIFIGRDSGARIVIPFKLKKQQS